MIAPRTFLPERAWNILGALPVAAGFVLMVALVVQDSSLARRALEGARSTSVGLRERRDSPPLSP
jgi:hypothetical protein